MGELKVVYVVGSGRSGSTLFGDILGQSPDVVHVGELLLYWERKAMVPPSRCGCGEMLTECPFWAAVAKRAPVASSLPPEFVERILQLGAWHRWPALWWQGRDGSTVFPEYADALRSFYEAIATQAGARVVVDTSKQPGQALVLATLGEIDSYFVHLTRDPRAVVSSWKTAKPDDLSPADSLPALGRFRATANWNTRALATEVLLASRVGPSRFLRLSFESFAAAPRSAYHEVATFIGERPSSGVFVGEREVQLQPSHTIAGNPDRHCGGVRAIGSADSWQERLSSREKRAIAALSAPMMWRLGYRGGAYGDREDVRAGSR